MIGCIRCGSYRLKMTGDHCQECFDDMYGDREHEEEDEQQVSAEDTPYELSEQIANEHTWESPQGLFFKLGFIIGWHMRNNTPHDLESIKNQIGYYDKY